MLIPGLVSVTFRQKTPLEICKLLMHAELCAVEWGGDVHVPPRTKSAAEIRRMSADHGIEICSYGSYYKIGQPIDEIKACLDTAVALGAPVVRIWGGSKGSAETSELERERIVEALIVCAEEARARRLILALEYHGGTLTDKRASVIRLLEETFTVADVLKFYWQPRFDWTKDERLASLEDIRARLSHLHVFAWRSLPNRNVRLPLAAEADMWNRVFASLAENHYALMEFVADDSDEALLRDASTLRNWCG